GGGGRSRPQRCSRRVRGDVGGGGRVPGGRSPSCVTGRELLSERGRAPGGRAPRGRAPRGRAPGRGAPGGRAPGGRLPGCLVPGLVVPVRVLQRGRLPGRGVEDRDRTGVLDRVDELVERLVRVRRLV